RSRGPRHVGLRRVRPGGRLLQRGQPADAARGEHRCPGAEEDLAPGRLPVPASAVAARGGRRGGLVCLPGPRAPQRPAVGGPARPGYRADLRPGAAAGVGPPGCGPGGLGGRGCLLGGPRGVPGGGGAHPAGSPPRDARRVWSHQDVALAAWGAGLVVCASLAVFLAAAEPTGGHPVPETRAWLSAVLVSGGLITALVLLGRRGSPVRRAASFAAASALT